MKRPTLDNYGLNESDIASYKKRNKWIWFPAIVLSIVICLSTAALINANSKSIHSLIEVLLYVCFLITIPLPPIGPFILHYLLNKLVRILDRNYDSYHQYVKASEEYEKEWIKTQSYFWYALTPKQFEIAVANIFDKSGYKSKVTDYVGDEGVDIWLQKNNQLYPVQCKAHKQPISPGAARELYGTMKSFGSKKGYLVSRSGFTKGVYEFCDDKQIKLMDLSNLIGMQKKISDIED